MKKEEFGIPFLSSEFKGGLNSNFDLEDFQKILSNPQKLWKDPSVKILLDSRNRVGVVDLDLNNKIWRVVIKSFRIKGINKLKSMVFPSKARKAWWGSWTLTKNRINTPYPIAYFERKKGFFIRESYFLSEMAEGAQEIRFLFKSLEGEALERLFEELAEFLSFVRMKGILHRDLSDGNILVCSSPNGGHRLFLIDTNRVRKIRFFPVLRSLKSLIRLGIPFRYQSSFIRSYLSPLSLNYFYWIWYRFNKKIFTGYIQIKKKLRVKKIADKLKIQ